MIVSVTNSIAEYWQRLLFLETLDTAEIISH
jgi:hypothetical protein